MGICAITFCACIFFTLSVTILHALSDVPLAASPKLSASLHLYMAIALGLFIWHMPMPALPQKFHGIFANACLLAFLAVLGASANLHKTAVNAISGKMLELQTLMDDRQQYLMSVRDKFPPDPFGLYGELVQPGIRRRDLDPGRPYAIVRQIPYSVFPVYLDAGLAAEFGAWPNLWAAWMYGCGAIKSAPPDPQIAIGVVLAGNGMELQVPQELKGISGAWRVTVQAGPNATFISDWLILKCGETRAVSVIKPAPADWRRLAPLPLQFYWLARLAVAERIKSDSYARLTGLFFHFENPFYRDGYLALPLGAPASQGQYLFASLDSMIYYRFRPYLH